MRWPCSSFRGHAGAGALAIVALAGSGCGPSEDDYPLTRPNAGPPDPSALEEEAPPDDGPTNVIEDDPLEDWDTEGAGPLSGIFAMELITPATVIVELELRQLYRLRLLERDGELRVKAQTCRLALPSVEGVAELTIPIDLELLIRSKVQDEVGMFLDAEDPSDPVGATFTPYDLFALLGAALDNPALDPLPTAAALETAVDDDGDGSPGITLLADVLFCDQREEVYAALRTGTSLVGTVDSLDAITGSAAPTLEQSVLGFSNDCLAAASDLPIEILEGSSFRAVRVSDALDINENGNVTCGEIVEAAPDLFGPYWDAP
jgi:hypothetical protein